MRALPTQAGGAGTPRRHTGGMKTFSTVRLVGQKEPSAMSLRVTHLSRNEQGEWKLLHCHADRLMSKTAPASVLRD